jgi:hypothetical protein
MKAGWIKILLSTACIISCKGPSPSLKPAADNNELADRGYRKPSGSYNDTLEVSKTSAVFFNADSAQLAKIRARMRPRDFDANMHEYAALLRYAHSAIKNEMPQLVIIEAVRTRYLLFIKADGSKTGIDLDSRPDPYGLFLFDPRKEPDYTDMANIGTELGFYFRK